MKKSKVDTDKRVCKNQECGKIHSAKEVKRVYGEGNPFYLGYCSAGCYTTSLLNKELDKNALGEKLLQADKELDA